MKLRNWYRQTRVHNTLTLDGRNFRNYAVCNQIVATGR